MKIELLDSDEQLAGKRRLTRVKGDSKQVVLWGDSEHAEHGEVVDESFGGIGLRFDTSLQFTAEQEFEVSYNGVQLWAVVRHVTEDDAGRHRVGLEWKASGLSRAARQTIEDDRDDVELSKFKETLPGGLYMMWRLFECGEWFQLGEKADKLRRLASRCEFAETLSNRVRRLQAAVELPDPKESSRKALLSLIEECVRVTGGNCDELS